MSIYLILKHAHSGIRWILLILLIFAVFNTIGKLLSRGKFTKGLRILAVMTMSFAHIQLLLGAALYFISPKVKFDSSGISSAAPRFYTLTHPAFMLIAIVLLTIGYMQAKRAKYDQVRLSRLFIFYLIALILILIAIPWPWRALGGGWF